MRNGGCRMDEAALRRELFILVGFLLTSAHGLYEEPRGYGPFRLLDGARRLTEAMAKHGMADAYVERLHTALEAACTGTAADEELRAIADGLVREYAGELKARMDKVP